MKADPQRVVPLPGLGQGPRPAEVEAEWVRRAQRGEREAFGRLVLLHQEAVMSTARYLTGSDEDAADIAQEAFLRAWRSVGGFEGLASFRTWILTITANVARSLGSHRRAKKRAGGEVRIDPGPGGEPIEVPEPGARNSPEARAIRAEVKEALERAIALLDDDSRAAVVLRDLGGESYEAIAAALGIPLGTVKSRIHRARLELRARLKDVL
ncbi:MAG: RNA polymerase sigma factor [Thermoanaerobaculia bacterium]